MFQDILIIMKSVASSVQNYILLNLIS